MLSWKHIEDLFLLSDIEHMKEYIKVSAAGICYYFSVRLSIH